MKHFTVTFLAIVIIQLVVGCNTSYGLNYDQMVILDAEYLAETGIGEAYYGLLPKLRQFVSHPADVEEVEDPDRPYYSVRSQDFEYVIYAPSLPDSEGQAWGRATYAFFAIVNRQLGQSKYRFYAINGGNDLGGIFLTEAECEASQRNLPNRTDWPYIPTDKGPLFGQHH